jgi:NAD(P)-dependent dehydrogenase (short-subunit alcohol dehydrogenase family)
MEFLARMFGLDEQVAIVTGGSGALGAAMAHGLAQAGARVVVVGRRAQAAEAVAQAITEAGGTALGLSVDVLQKEQLRHARDAVLARWGRIDILVNAAGGNVPGATLGTERSIFQLDEAAFRQVFDLNMLGTLLPTQVFGEAMAQQKRGCVVNISSAAAGRALSRVVGYAAAKSAVENFTRWMAVELARSYGSELRVNAIAPGFFIGEQNRSLLLDADGTPTARGQAIIDHTPAGRFGEPGELVATLLWLCGAGASFVNGTVIPVDGGFAAWTGF